jgi:hypothetical protein
MWQGEEDRVGRRELGVDRQTGPHELGVDPLDRVVVSAATHETDQIDVRVPGEEPDELGTDVPGGPNDPDPDPPWPTGWIDAPLGSWQESSSAIRHDPGWCTDSRAHGRGSWPGPAKTPLSEAKLGCSTGSGWIAVMVV